jgi:hypothetical protein
MDNRFYLTETQCNLISCVCQFSGAIIIFIQKIINYLIIYFFFVDLRIGLHPYSDINDSFYPNVISSNAVIFKIFCCFIGVVLSSLLLLFLFCIYKFNILKVSKNFLILLLFVSTIEIAWFSSSFLKLKSISDLVENCEFANQVQVGCYVPPEKIRALLN